MRSRLFSIALIALFGALSSAHATLLYDSDADSTFTLLDSAGMIITADPGPELPSTSVTGTATASIDADVQSLATSGGTGPLLGVSPFTVGDTIIQSSAVSGSAGPPGGFSSGTVLNGVLITLDNSAGLTDATAVFEFTYTWFAEVIQTDAIDALKEIGDASPFFHLTGFSPSGDETLAIDEMMGGGIVGVSDWLVNPAVGLGLSDPTPSVTESGTATVLAYVTVPTGSIDAFSVITDSFGSAAHIPIPGVALLLGTGLLALGWSRRQVC